MAETRWSSGRQRAKAPALVVAAFRHFDNRDGFPLLHEHCLILNRVQRPDGTWYALDTRRLYQHVVAAGTLNTLTMTTQVCEELGLATVAREVTPGLRPVMEIAGVDQELIDWSSTRRQRIEDALEGIIDQYVKDHGRLPSERGRHGLGWWAAQDARPAKRTPHPLEQLRAWWRASAILRFGKRMVDGLLERCRAAGKAIREQVGPRVDTALATHVLAEARRHLLEMLRGRVFRPGLDDYITDEALACHSRQLTVPVTGRRTPAPDQITFTPDFAWPHRWWIAGTAGKPPRESSRYERAGSPASPCRTRSATPAPHPLPREPEPRLRPGSSGPRPCGTVLTGYRGAVRRGLGELAPEPVGQCDRSQAARPCVSRHGRAFLLAGWRKSDCGSGLLAPGRRDVRAG
nr:MobF family relaxase [Streptomyces sp. FXJ1.172]WEP00055.1 MobF family relaxase [Streptomyces sp. FXJ1.172]